MRISAGGDLGIIKEVYSLEAHFFMHFPPDAVVFLDDELMLVVKRSNILRVDVLKSKLGCFYGIYSFRSTKLYAAFVIYIRADGLALYS